ncbi:MAG TPA: family 10 glycosylhydrolase [Coleofasciculaceae cyanobacterium]|jgi:uncharacterized lipoprotein YddW (UPF0748 family)
MVDSHQKVLSWLQQLRGKSQAKRSISWQRRLRSVGLLGLGMAIALMARFPAAALAQVSARPAASSAEIRGVWLTNIDSEVLFSKDNLRQGIRRLERLNFNTIYPTVWNGGYTLYPSDVAEAASGQKIDPEPAFEKRDMLEEAVALAHGRDLAVIPWFEFGLMAPAESELVRLHPDWVSARQDGNKIFNVHGSDRSVWLSPAHPQVQQFLADLVAEVVTKYDVDGIQFDDHLGMPVSVGYDAYTVQLYKQEHKGKTPPTNPQDPEWMKWRAAKLSDLMVKIYSSVKTHKPDCIISLSPNPKEYAYQTHLQDWYAWQRLGFIDELIVQVYRTDNNRFTSELSRPELQAVRRKIPVGIGILTGLSALNVETGQIQRQVQIARDRQFSGISFFFYETLNNRDAAIEALFASPATRPDIRTYSAGV